MKQLKIVKSNVLSTQKLNTNRTPKDIALVKSSKDNDSIDPLSAKTQRTSTLKQKITKTERRKHTRQKSDFKENSNNTLMDKGGEIPRQLRRENSANREAGKCIKQIEQELSQLKKLTKIQNLNDLNKEEPENLLKIVKDKYLSCPIFNSQLKILISNNKEDKQTQTHDETNKRQITDYEKKIAEMKRSVYEIKKHMQELELLYKKDSQKIYQLEDTLRLTNEKLNNSQAEVQRLAVYSL